MRRFSLFAFALVCLIRPTAGLAQSAQSAPPPPVAPAASSVGTTVDTFMIKMYPNLRKFMIGAVEKMPESAFSLRPGTDGRTFAEAVNHIGVSNLGQCRNVIGSAVPAGELAELRKSAMTKPALLKLLNDGFTACDQVFASPGDDRAALTRASLSVHTWEMYGTLAVYLRMQGLVPPSTEAQNKARGGDHPGLR